MLSPCWEALIKKNQSELRAKLLNQSEIVFKSGEVGHNLRGDTLHGVIIDEVRDQPKELWSQIVQPMVRTTKGWVAFVSTPNGFDEFYELYNRNGKDGWESFHAPSSCNPLFTQDEFEEAKRSMSEAEFAQEILAEFRDLVSGKAYLNHSTANQSTYNLFSPNHLITPHLPIVVGMDFNVNPMVWVLGQNKGEDWYFFDEIALKHTHTQEAAQVLVTKLKGHQAGVILIGDATGKARKTAAAGETDYSIITHALSAAGIKWENATPESNPPVKDRVNVMNAKLKDAQGQIHLWYHPTNCPQLKRDFERVVWKQNAAGVILDQTKDPTLTHASDAAGYPVFARTGIWKPSAGGLRVIRRV